MTDEKILRWIGTTQKYKLTYYLHFDGKTWTFANLDSTPKSHDAQHPDDQQ